MDFLTGRHHTAPQQDLTAKAPQIESDPMSKDPERITILAREFTAAALEFHRGKMAEKGYRMEGSITPRSFKMIEGMAPPKDLFDGDALFAVTFVKRDSAG